MINKVSLKNWRSHQDSEFLFGTGTNALLGIIGSGKSSVLDAVCFCLFGTFPNLQSRKLKIEDILMRKPVQKDRAEVEVYFTEGGKTYSVKRVIERGKGTTYSEVREGGRILESPNTSRVNELVEKILKVSYDLFSKAVYSEQNSLDYFLTIPRGQRMKRIDELLGIDRFERARTNSVALANKLLDRRETKRGIVQAAGLEQAEALLAETRASVDAAKREVSELDSQLRDARGQRERIEREIGEARKTKSILEEVRREEKGVASLVEDTYKSLQRLEEAMEGQDKDAVEKSLREVVRYLSETEGMFREEQRKCAKLQDQAVKAKTEAEIHHRERLARLEKELEEKSRLRQEMKKRRLTPERAEEEMDEKKRLVEKFDAEMEVLKMRVQDLQEVIKQIDEAEAKCPLCDSKMTKEKKIMLVKRKQFEIDKMKEKWAKAAKGRDVSSREIEEMERSLGKVQEMLEAIKDIDKVQSELGSAKSIYAVLKEQASSFEKELKEAVKEVEKMEASIGDARTRKEQLESLALKARDYSEKRGKIESLLMKRKQLEAGIKQLEDALVGKENTELENRWEKLVTAEKETAGRIGGTQQVMREKELRLRETELKVGGAMKELEGMRKLDKTVEELKAFEKALAATQIQLRKEFVASVNYTMNEIWTTLYPYHDFDQVQIAIEEGDYVLQLQENSGRWVNVEGFASGGERSIAALTLRIAFALVLAPQLKWLVLDEPTANMDVKSVEDLATTLSEHIGNFIDQTFLITHDEKLEAAVTGNAYRLERDKSRDGFTRVVPIG